MNKHESIKKHGITASGRKELLKYLNGDRITLRQAIIAKCYDCMGFYRDGRRDCEDIDCPLYSFMPYSSKPKTSSRKLSDVHKAKLRATFKAVGTHKKGVSAS